MIITERNEELERWRSMMSPEEFKGKFPYYRYQPPKKLFGLTEEELRHAMNNNDAHIVKDWSIQYIDRLIQNDRFDALKRSVKTEMKEHALDAVLQYYNYKKRPEDYNPISYLHQIIQSSFARIFNYNQERKEL